MPRRFIEVDSRTRSSLIDTFPFSRSYIAGILCALTGVPSLIFRMRRRLAGGASAIVMITWSIPSAETSVGRGSVDPNRKRSSRRSQRALRRRLTLRSGPCRRRISSSETPPSFL